MRNIFVLAALLVSVGCAGKEARLREELARGTGTVQLPAGVVEVSSELVIPRGAYDLRIEGSPSGTVLRASGRFRGRAVLRLESSSGVTLAGFAIDGNRTALQKPAGLPPANLPFYRFTEMNGILAEEAYGLRISGVQLRNIAGFAVLVAASDDVRIEDVQVSDSGSLNARGRNNTTGGILLEEGTTSFQVLGSTLRNVLGNGIWTHSLYTAARNADGLISKNRFENIARDAIQVGHATGVQVTENTGSRIGYPFERIDVEGGGTPVAIDTAGNVDRTSYTANHFEEVNGQCIDLDGFHDGSVTGNSCTNRGAAEDYPNGHYGIVFGNSNPDMQPDNILISGNLIDGAKYGGIFVIGSSNRIEDNRFLRLNLAHCNDAGAKYSCFYYPKEPDLMRSGIYLGLGAARPAAARGNVIRGNEVSGYGMKAHCIAAAPGVPLTQNKLERNRCSDQ